MMTSLTLGVRREGDSVVLGAVGEIDVSNLDAFTKALTAAVREAESRSSTFTVDLSAVEYLDSAAINALFLHADRIDVVLVNPLLTSTLAVSGLSELCKVQTARPS